MPGEEELSLVTTQVLRRILGAEEDKPEEASDAQGGYNPYDSR
jgi:hypothetical protein